MEKITLKCDKEIASDSPDHTSPHGTKNDNGRNKQFNKKLNRLYGKPIKVLDLGCAGGGFVRDCLDDGNMAIGLEGSDYSKKHKRAEWNNIPNNLFTCDITKNFDIYANKEPIKFNVITAWEVLEHIKEEDLPILIRNIIRHLDEDGLIILSISNVPSHPDGVELHQTQKPKKWWINLFFKYDLFYRQEYLDYFNAEYVNGSYEVGFNFHVIFSKQTACLPSPPKLDTINNVKNKTNALMGSLVKGTIGGIGNFKYSILHSPTKVKKQN